MDREGTLRAPTALKSLSVLSVNYHGPDLCPSSLHLRTDASWAASEARSNRRKWKNKQEDNYWQSSDCPHVRSVSVIGASGGGASVESIC